MLRYVALVALLDTLYNIQSLTAAVTKRTTTATQEAIASHNPALLRALVEKVLDGNVPCTTTTVGCLLNCVAFYYGGRDVLEEEEGHSWGKDEMAVATDVLVPILQQQIHASLATLRGLGRRLVTLTAAVVVGSILNRYR